MLAAAVGSDQFVKTEPRSGSLRRFCPGRSVDELPYFHGDLSRRAAEAKLRKTGDFLLRRDPPDYALVLSVRLDDGLFHHQLLVKDNDVYRLPRKPHVKTEEEYVNYFYEYKYPLLAHCFLLMPVQQRSNLSQQEVIATEPRQGTLLAFGRPRPNHELPYYHGTLSGRDAERLLTKPDQFLARLDPPDNALVLSVRGHDQQCRHLLLQQEDGVYKLPAEPHVTTLEEYVNYFSIYSFPILPKVFLLEPVHKIP